VRGDLPSGTVTFVFTDVEGSTKLLHELGAEAYADALASHRGVLRAAFAAYGGVEVDTQGDAFFVAFPTAPGALAAAAEAQAGLAAGPLMVRVGLHTGTPHLADEGYVGVDVHRAARIAAAGHGGQVLVSASTAALVGDDGLQDLGEHRLKDLSAPERVYQVGSGDFPPLKSLYRTNLPIPATPFLGRERELADVLALLSQADARLVTLNGPGGTGKTRLGLQAAAEAAEWYPDGVFWVPLAQLRDPKLVLEEAALALGTKESLVDHVGDKSLLLLFDNFEHLMEAAVSLSELLARCPNLGLMVTSRELLRVPGEHAYPVPPLDPQDGTELFLARARAVLPGFVADESVQELCARLEQLPLALELAAARVRVLSAEQLLERLSQRLDLFKGSRGADPRQQTLRATIEWSYELLTSGEQGLFTRLAVFRDGCTLDSAEKICDADLDTLESLVDKSLVRVREGDRFWMLETIREYAAERLDATGDAETLRRRHAEYFCAVAEAAGVEIWGAQQAVILARLEQDHANLRAALEWGLRFAPTLAPPNLGLRLAAALAFFWSMRGHLREGRSWLERVLAQPAEEGPVRARAMFGAALLAALQSDWPEAKRWSVECRRLSLVLGELPLAAQSLLTLGRATLAEGDTAEAAGLFREAAASAAAIQDMRLVAMSRFNLGYLELVRGDYEAAHTELDAARNSFTAADDRYGVGRSLAALGSVALHRKQTDEAVVLLQNSLRHSRTLADVDDISWALELLGVAWAELGNPAAARLLGAAEALRESLGGALEGVELALHERGLAALAAGPDNAAAEAAWAAGGTLTADEAVVLALDSVPSKSDFEPTP
jgi:predicted ATPase/class 3 adenylate cyclase